MRPQLAQIVLYRTADGVQRPAVVCKVQECVCAEQDPDAPESYLVDLHVLGDLVGVLQAPVVVERQFHPTANHHWCFRPRKSAVRVVLRNFEEAQVRGQARPRFTLAAIADLVATRWEEVRNHATRDGASVLVNEIRFSTFTELVDRLREAVTNADVAASRSRPVLVVTHTKPRAADRVSAVNVMLIAMNGLLTAMSDPRITDEGRAKVFDSLNNVYCRNCGGARRASPRGCQCTNDE